MKTDAEKKIRSNSYIIARVDWVGGVHICSTCRGRKEAEDGRKYWALLYEEEIKRGQYTIVIYKAVI